MKNIWLYTCMVSFLFIACKKEVERSAPHFEVTTESSIYAVNEEVEFKFSGDADLISFYSGEVLSDYAFKDGRIVEQGELALSFQTNVQFGTQENQLSLLASTDFNGKYQFVGGIDDATWIDLTPLITLATGTTYVKSSDPPIDLSEIVVDGKPLYLAFKYTVKDQRTTANGGYGVGRTWRVQDFLLTSETSLGLLTLGNLLTSGFQLVDMKPDIAPARSVLSPTTLSMVAHDRTLNNSETVESENWAITKGFEVGTQDLGPDRPVPIKGVIDAPMKSYTYTYTKPGKYRVYFVASNTNIYNSYEIVRSVDIEIVE